MTDTASPLPSSSYGEQTYAHRLAAIAEIGRTVISILDLPTQLRTLASLLQEQLGFYAANIWILTEPAENVQLKGGLSPTGQDLGSLEIQTPISAENSITWVCQTGVLYLKDMLENLESLPLGRYFPDARSQLVLPLKIAQKKVGALEILSRVPEAFNVDDTVLLRSLADQATIAIRNATLYQAEQSRRRLAETLYQIGRALSSTIHLDEVLRLILKHLDEIVPTNRSAVMLRDGNYLEFVSTREFPADFNPSGLRIPLHGNPSYSQVVETQRPLSIPDVDLHPDWQQIMGLPPARSWMGVPLISARPVAGDHVIGVLSLERSHLEPYSYAEVTLAMTFAGQAVIALENAQLYTQLEQFNQELEERVQKRTEELRSAYDKLERLDQTKTTFIKVTSHELRTPLTVLLGYSQMLMQNPAITGDDMANQLVAGIYSGADRLHDIVNSMLDIVKIDSSALELSPEPVSLDLIVRNVAGNFKNVLRNREISLAIEGLAGIPKVEADSLALQKVFYQLLSNAIKYTPNGGSIDIWGLSHPGSDGQPSSVEVVIKDSGIGIAPEVQELIFTKFYQTGEVALHSSSRTQFKGGGPGLGLPIARGIIQAHGGRLWVESPGYDEESLPGSQFHVVLPCIAEEPISPGSDEAEESSSQSGRI